ncbi:MerR family transcriptional regulator [Amycolatopsis sp., V23-08]|uniref:MerR family transcriptional regulator n=1 Tax=Amycolatopsis heterodermiae TaxID=3110235 RepID=A0ABU5RP04_9PSEU|nr:MerR family transcriptional regulator [Amycolatopsis sp., V23-08]MEA5367254.1 MerR family transcriptional regulator [Amycolatopsis sp., V23-08]
MSERTLPIGELAARTGVPATTLRYYDELGLVRPSARDGGRRRYAESAVEDVGVIVFFREIGFTLAEIASFLSGEGEGDGRRELIERKLAELAERQHRIEVARTALEHGQRCPSGEPLTCPRFRTIVDGRQRGLSLEESHARAHLAP